MLSKLARYGTGAVATGLVAISFNQIKDILDKDAERQSKRNIPLRDRYKQQGGSILAEHGMIADRINEEFFKEVYKVCFADAKDKKRVYTSVNIQELEEIIDALLTEDEREYVRSSNPRKWAYTGDNLQITSIEKHFQEQYRTFYPIEEPAYLDFSQQLSKSSIGKQTKPSSTSNKEENNNQANHHLIVTLLTLAASRSERLDNNFHRCSQLINQVDVELGRQLALCLHSDDALSETIADTAARIAIVGLGLASLNWIIEKVNSRSSADSVGSEVVDKTAATTATPAAAADSTAVSPTSSASAFKGSNINSNNKPTATNNYHSLLLSTSSSSSTTLSSSSTSSSSPSRTAALFNKYLPSFFNKQRRSFSFFMSPTFLFATILGVPLVWSGSQFWSDTLPSLLSHYAPFKTFLFDELLLPTMFDTEEEVEDCLAQEKEAIAGLTALKATKVSADTSATTIAEQEQQEEKMVDQIMKLQDKRRQLTRVLDSLQKDLEEYAKLPQQRPYYPGMSQINFLPTSKATAAEDKTATGTTANKTATDAAAKTADSSAANKPANSNTNNNTNNANNNNNQPHNSNNRSKSPSSTSHLAEPGSMHSPILPMWNDVDPSSWQAMIIHQYLIPYSSLFVHIHLLFPLLANTLHLSRIAAYLLTSASYAWQHRSLVMSGQLAPIPMVAPIAEDLFYHATICQFLLFAYHRLILPRTVFLARPFTLLPSMISSFALLAFYHSLFANKYHLLEMILSDPTEYILEFFPSSHKQFIAFFVNTLMNQRTLSMWITYDEDIELLPDLNKVTIKLSPTKEQYNQVIEQYSSDHFSSSSAGSSSYSIEEDIRKKKMKVSDIVDVIYALEYAMKEQEREEESRRKLHSKVESKEKQKMKQKSSSSLIDIMLQAFLPSSLLEKEEDDYTLPATAAAIAADKDAEEDELPLGQLPPWYQRNYAFNYAISPSRDYAKLATIKPTIVASIKGHLLEEMIQKLCLEQRMKVKNKHYNKHNNNHHNNNNKRDKVTVLPPEHEINYLTANEFESFLQTFLTFNYPVNTSQPELLHRIIHRDDQYEGSSSSKGVVVGGGSIKQVAAASYEEMLDLIEAYYQQRLIADEITFRYYEPALYRQWEQYLCGRKPSIAEQQTFYRALWNLHTIIRRRYFLTWLQEEAGMHQAHFIHLMERYRSRSPTVDSLIKDWETYLLSSKYMEHNLGMIPGLEYQRLSPTFLQSIQTKSVAMLHGKGQQKAVLVDDSNHSNNHNSNNNIDYHKHMMYDGLIRAVGTRR